MSVDTPMVGDSAFGRRRRALGRTRAIPRDALLPTLISCELRVRVTELFIGRVA